MRAIGKRLIFDDFTENAIRESFGWGGGIFGAFRESNERLPELECFGL